MSGLNQENPLVIVVRLIVAPYVHLLPIYIDRLKLTGHSAIELIMNNIPEITTLIHFLDV